MINLSDNNLIGPPKLTRFERARIVGARALQISLGAPILASISEKRFLLLQYDELFLKEPIKIFLWLIYSSRGF
jgi:DNA-directed RNA polymerase subunit K